MLLYAHQDRDVAAVPTETVKVASLFGVWDESAKSSLIAHYELRFDGYSNADKIPYVGISDRKEFELAVLAWE